MKDYDDVNATAAVDLPGALHATARHENVEVLFEQQDTVAYRKPDETGLQFIDARAVIVGGVTFRMNIGVNKNAAPKEYIINDATTDALVVFRGHSYFSMVTGAMRVTKNDAGGLEGSFNGRATLDGRLYEISCREFKVVLP